MILLDGVYIDDAEKNFSEEFDYIYDRYNQLSDKEMSERIRRTKNILNSMVKKIEA